MSNYYLKKTEFKLSIADMAGYQKFALENPASEICVVGRSNVGKSSFINLIAGRNKLAKTSSTPGRTRLLNIFDFCVGDKEKSNLKDNGEFLLVDLPGYGYAKAPKTEIAKWGDLIGQYFATTEKLLHVFSLVDIRHAPSELDKTMIKFLSANGIPLTIIATKADKIAPSQLARFVQSLASGLAIGAANIIPTSILSGKGKQESINRLGQIFTV